MAPDKRDQLYDNLIGSGKVTEDEIGNREEFKNAVKDENSSRQFYKNLLGSGKLSADEIGTEDQFYDAISSDFSTPTTEPEESVQESHPSFADEFQDTINSAMQTVGQSRQAVNRIGNIEQRFGLKLPKGDFGRVNIGENRKVTKGKQRLNQETGKLEETYVTPQGNEYEKRELADIEQNIVDQEEWERNNPKEALRLKIDSQIAELEAKQKELTGPGGAPTNVFSNMYAGGAGVPVRKTANDQRLDDITMALNDLKDARTRMDRGEQLQASSDFLGGIGVPFTKDWFNNWKNFGYGIWDTLSDPGLYDFGITDMAKAGMYGRIKRKMESGEELSDSETALALAGMAKAQAEQLVTLPHGYTAGVTTTEMAPFMAQMAMNPASGFGRSFARQAVRKFGKDGIKAVSARVGARVLGNVAEAGVLSNTLQAGKTAADVMRRYTGDTFQYSDDGKRLMIGHYEDGPDGEPVFVEGGKGLAESVWEGEAASIIENFTELGAGGNINKFLSKMAGTKAGQAIGLGYINDLVGKVGATPFARNMKKFMERTHWDGMIEEPLEEEYGIILNSLLTGDNKISDLWDSEQQADIFAGTMWFGGFMAGMNTAAYPFYRRRIKKELSRADLAGQQAFGDEWEVMKAGIDEMDDKQVVQYLYDIKSNDSFNNDQKAAMFAYTSRLKQQQGANTADMLMRMEGNLSKPETDVRNAYDRGVDLEEPQEMNEAKMNLEIQQQRLGEMLEGYDLVREEFEKNPLGALEGFVGNENWTPEDKQTAIDYVNARMTYDGMLDGVRDDIAGKIESSNALIDKRTNPTDNMIHHATTKTDDDIYIIGGTVVMDESGANIDVEASIQATGGDNMILAIDTNTGQVKSYSIDDILNVDEPTDANQMKQEAADNIRQITAREAADKIDGRLTFQPDDQYQVIDEEGAAHTIQIVADNGDGTVEALIDGAGEPMPMAMQDIQVMADRYNQQRVIMQQAELQAKHAAENGSISQQNGENITENAENSQNYAQNPAENIQDSQNEEQQQSALDRIPVVSNEQGEPILNRKGEVTYLWHEAPVDDTTDALVEMTEGDMVMARDTAASMIENAKADLQKANKLKATGSDPLSIINSRKANAQAVQQAQAIVKYWQDVNTAIRKRMEAESAARLAEIEAAKSAEQKAREAEEARIRKEEQDKRDRERLHEQIERDRERRTQPYQPIVDARKELAGDAESLAILDDLEPRSLEEWVSSLLSPHSMLWLDASDAEVGLQTELGLKRADMQRFMQLLGTKESGAKPFGKVVLDIYEALPEGMKNQYDSEDVRRVVLEMFQGMESSTQMMHLTELNRINEARQTAQENERRDHEAEMEAWAEAYHLNPEERETFEAFVQEPPSEPEQEIINNIIAEYEQNRRSEELDQQPVGRTDVSGVEGGEGQVQQETEGAGGSNNAEATTQGAEAEGGEQAPADNDVSGAEQRVAIAGLFEQLGADINVVDEMSDYEVEQLTAMMEEADTTQDADAIEQVQQYVEGLQTKYEFADSEGAIPTPSIDNPRYQAIRQALIDAYTSGDQAAITAAAQAIQQYVDEGLDSDGVYSEEVDDYEGDDPTMLADQYLIHVFQDRYLDDDEDPEYIRTGLKPNMRQDNVFASYNGKNFVSNKHRVCTNPNVIEKNGKGAAKYKIKTAFTDEGWVGALEIDGSTWGDGGPVTATDNDRYFGTEEECQAYYAARAIDRIKRHDDKNANSLIPSLLEIANKAQTPEMFKEETQNEPIGKTSSPEEIAAEEAKVDTNPTDGQKEAGNYQKGHINIDGYDVTIENPKGSVRSGVDGNGKAWEQEMRNTYGYIRGTEGVDGDHIDVFLSDNPTSGSVFVVDQIDPDTLEFDEHKVMYGFPDAESAEKAYLSNYEEGWGGLGEITEVSREDFKKWVESSHRKTKPFAEYKSVKPQRPSTDSPEGEILVNGGTIMKNNIAGGDAVVRIVGSNIDKKTGKRRYSVEYYSDEQAVSERVAIGDGEIGQDEMRQHLANGDFSSMEKGQKKEENNKKPEKKKEERQHKRIVSDDKMEELRKQLLAKFNNLNAGIDVERMLLGAMYAVGKIERGVTKFADYAREMVEEIGDGIRPYLKAFYEAVRNMPEAAEYRDQMTSPEEVAAFDEYNFDKAKAPDTFTKAEQVVRKQKAKQQVKNIEKEVKQKIQQGDLFAGDLFGEQERQGNNQEGRVIDQQRQAIEKPKPKNAWWNDPNRPQSLDPKDYKTYMTEEAKEYFANYPLFAAYKRRNLAFVTTAVWDGLEIPPEELKKQADVIEAENVVKDATANGVLEISNEELDKHAQHLLDAEHGSAVFEKGKIRKVNGVEDFSGPVRQERKALIIIGLPAGGKSSVFANPLSNQYGARIIDSDVVKPWLEGFDDGNGAGYVQNASSDVAERALDIAVGNGDNIILPRIGGDSVIRLSAALRLAGYDVQLYYNDVTTTTSVNRATSRFAETGRYLSLDYLTSKDGVPSNNFSKFAEKTIGDYLNELSEGEIQKLRGRLGRLLGSEDFNGTGLRQPSADTREGYRNLDEYVSALLESGRSGSSARTGDLNSGTPIFSYAEWKSNDVPFGEKPKEIWNSKSGKPMPGTKIEGNDNVQSEQRLPGEPSSSGEGEKQEGRGSERSGAERGPEQDRAERSGRGRTVTQEPAKPKQAPKNKNKRNNVGERGKDYAPTTPKARFNANVEAIKLMRELMDEGVEAPTKEQMEVLRKYSGWGGLGTFFNDATTAEYRELRDLLTEEEYKDAVMSINSAYYTPATVIDTLWDIAGAMGFDGGNVLEGSAGIGNIIGQMPRKLSSQSNIEAVEIDKISGNILKLLYPDAKVHIEGFQDVTIPNGSVDLAITNVPFVTGLHVFDKVDKDLSRKFVNIHDFCIAKNIRKLREGGIGIFISSAGTLDKSTDLRAWIIDEGQADVVGAFRLNNDTFGGTNVTSDIIVVRKRVNNEKSPNAIDVSKATPMRVGTYTDKFEKEHQTAMTVNDYFQQHPEMMAGEMFFGYEKGDTFRPGSYGLYPTEGKNQDKMMADFAKGMKKAKEVPTVSPVEAQKPDTNQLTEVKEGRMLIDDKGRLCVSRYGTAWPLGLNDQKVKGQTKQQCFKDYQDVQKAVDEVLQQQLNDPDDAKLDPKLKALNAAYDKFVKRYGTLHKNTAISFLRNDIDFPSFQALENYSETKDMNGKVKVITSKTPIFSKRVLGFKTEPQPKTVKDAVIASMFRTNGIDLEWIAAKLSEVAAPPNGDNWTADDVRKGILVSRLGFEDPATGQVEIRYKYLSGNVREKLAMAEAYNTDGRYNANVEELRKAVPMDIPSHLIEFSLGSSWIPEELYKEYLKENFDLSGVKLTHVEGNWVLDEGWGFRNEKNRAAGVYSEQFRETIYGHQLVAAALNNRPVKVAKQVTEGWGSSKTTKTVVDKNATQACAVRVDEIKDEFRQWAKQKMQDDPELAQRIEKIYNEKFNALVPMEIDKEFLPDHFEGSNVNITLRPHQKTGAMRGLTAPTMLAHEVGTGKSFTLITTAMEMRRLGTARKPMLVVQNATVAQLTSDAKLLYPNAKVLSLTERDRDAEGRRAFYAKIKYNDWDLIIIPQSTFERIPDSPERELQFIQEKIDEKKHVIEAAMQSGMDAREIQRLKKELEKMEQEYGDTYVDRSDEITTEKKGKKKDAKKEAAALDKAETKAKEQLDRATDDVQYFDDLGVDALLVDEAHEYKHLGFQTSIGRGIKGIDPSYSKKCAGLYNKTRSVFEQAGWKNVVFATGTPISNTAAEIWTFMKYLMPADVMRANDIYYFDDFVHNFGAISQMLEFTTSGKFKENTRFAAYVNRPELIRIWTQVADIVLSRDSKEVLAKLPQKEGGKDQDVFLPQSPSLVSIMAAVRAELDRFENMTGQEKKENSSIPLTMYGIAKRAAIDPRLVNPDAPDEPMSKTNAAVKEIVKDLKDTDKYKGTVAVFCDNQNRLGTNAAGKKVVEFNIYDDMKEKLIKAGVPESQIAIIKSGMSITAKQKIFDAVNSGAIRVVLGSTQTLGTGVNMQERLHLLIHMDAPDRPMDYTQRNGRIERQGNLHKEWGIPIRIVRFGVEDSLDVTAYQRLKTKSAFIDSIMDGKSALANNQVDRTVEEEEEGLFDNPVAVLSGSQYALKKNQAERELRKYLGKKAQWQADQVYVTNQLRRNKTEVEATEANIREEEKQLAHIRSLFPDGKVKNITVEGTKIDMTKDDGAKKLGDAIKEKINDPVNAIVKRNRENPIYNDETMKYTIALDGHNVIFTVQVIRESVVENGRMRTVIHKYTSYDSPDLRINSMTSSTSVREHLDNILDDVVTGRDYEDRIEAYNAKIERISSETKQLEQRVGMEFQYDKELEQAQKNVEEYTELMKKEMEEKEAKYAAQQKEAKENGGFDLNKAEETEDEDDGVRYRSDETWDDDVSLEDEPPLFRGIDMFAEGQTFPIHVTHAYSDFDVTSRRATYQTDLLPDEYTSLPAFLDAVRNAYPAYYATIENGDIIMQSWNKVLAESRKADKVKNRKGTESYVERKTRRAIEAVNDLAQRMHLDVEVLTTTDGLTGKKARSKGWFNPRTHKIVIVLPNHTTKSDVINTLLHEGVAHYGLRKMFGRNFDIFLDNVYNNVSPEIKARIDAAMKRNGWGRYEATEEYLARLAEHTDFENATMSGWWHKIKEFFMEMLAKAGFSTTLTDNELRYILWRSYDNLVHPGRRTIFDTAREIQMKSRLKVGDFAERIRIQRTGMVDTSSMVAAERVGEELLNRTDYAGYEINSIVDKAKADGTYMTAPSGKPSNLNELQWAQVRTKAFKDWFGDWENDPENASKVVDENGEPMVMYHGTNLDAVNNGEPFWTFYTNQHFGTKEQAKDRVDGKGKLYEVFLNIRNPQRRNDADQDYLEDHDMTMSEYWEQSVERAKSKGHDGIVYLNEYEDMENPADSWIAFNPSQIKSATENSGDFSTEDNDIRYSIRTKEPPKKTGKGYKVFVLKDGQLYPPMVANPNGEGTPVGVWLDADAAPIAGQSKTGRPQVKAGGKGTQGGSGQLAYRPGWHLGTIPYALQFNRKDADGERSLFPNNFVWAEVEYADDIDYQDEAYNEGVNDNGKFQHSLAGLKRVPTDGSYKYRTNPDPRTDEWVITGAMRVNRILSREEVDDLVRKAGREPQKIQDGDILTQDIVDGLNAEIKATEEADEMGLLYRDDDSWDEEPIEVETSPVSLARRIYEDAVKDTGDRMMITALWNAIPKKKDGRWNTEGWERFKHKFAESWLDYTRSIKALQDAIEKVTGKAITDFEDVWRSLNAKSSIDNVEIQAVMDKYIAPLSEHIARMVKGKRIDGHEMTIDDVEKYLNAVHGPERNIRMAMKQAQEEYDNDTELLRQQIDTPELDARERQSLLLKLQKKEARFNGIKNYMTIPAIAQWWNQWRISVERQHNSGGMTDEQYAKAKEKMQMEYQTGWKYKYRDRDYSGLTALFSDNFGEGEKVTENMLEQAARDYATEFEDIVGKDMADELWDLVKALNNYSLRKSYISGLISKQQYDDTLSMYEHYVPLRGWHDDYAGDVYQYISRGEPAEVLQGVLKKAYGRKSRAARILGTMAAMANTAIVQGNKNRVAQKLMNLASRSGDAGLLMLTEQWYQKDAHDNLVPLFPDLREDMTAEEMQDEIIRFEEDMEERAARNEVQQLKKKFKKEFPLKMAKWQEQRHAVRVMRNGKEYMVYVLGDPKAAEAFNGMLNPHSQLGAISNVLSKYMRFRAKWQTSLSPEFLISNFQRDVMTASTGAYVKYGKQVQKQFVKNLAKVMPFSAVRAIKQGRKPENVAGIFSLLKKYDSNTIDRNNETERLFDEFVRNGGMTGISYITRAEEYQASMEDVIRRMRQGKLSMPGEISKAVGDAVEFANKGIENATRFAMYMTSRQNGKTIVESIFDAKEASVNFNMKGSGAWGNMMARRLYLYVNPAMQALRMLGTWYENDPLVAVKEGGTMVTKEVTRRFMKAAAMTLTASAGLAVVNILLSALFGHGDGDDDDSLPTDWWGLSEWNRYNYVNIINPFSKGYFHWSIPQEMRPLWALGQIGVDLVAGKVTPQHALNSMLAQLNNLSPLSFIEGGTSTDDSTISSLIRTFTPTFVGEFTDAYGWNRDFMGNRITNQMEWNKDAPEWQRASDETPAVFINTSRRVNELLGGRYNRRSRFESRYANPSALYYILTQQYGGIGSMAKRFLTLADQAFDPEEDMEIRNIPFLPKFYVSTGDDYSMNRMMNEKFRIYWDEFKDAEYELAADRRKVAAGEMTQEEADKTIEERKADGTYNTWRIIEGNNLDNIYNQFKGTKKQGEVRQMIVDAVENGTLPDFESLRDNADNTEQRDLWEKSIDKQYRSNVDDVTDDDLDRAFDDAEGVTYRRLMARRISKQEGASKDPYGSRSDKEYNTLYQELRTAEDVREDAELLRLQEDAKQQGDNDRAEEISKERQRIRDNIRGMERGDKAGNEQAMRDLREDRRRLLTQYGIKR